MPTSHRNDDQQRDLLRRIEAMSNTAAERIWQRLVLPAPPFRALLDRSSDMVWINYAVPVAPLDDPAVVERGLAELRHLFAYHQRRLRFEFTAALWPSLPGLLEQAGLHLQEGTPLMCCTPPEFQPSRAADVVVQLLEPSNDTDFLATYLSVQRRGFAEAAPLDAPTADAVAHLRGALTAGSLRAALATLGGVPAGAGAVQRLPAGDPAAAPAGTRPTRATAQQDPAVPGQPASAADLGELVGLATLPAQRRRGVAAALSSALVADHFHRGGTLVWLSAAAEAQRVYTRIGFQPAGERLNYIE